MCKLSCDHLFHQDSSDQTYSTNEDNHNSGTIDSPTADNGLNWCESLLSQGHQPQSDSALKRSCDVTSFSLHTQEGSAKHQRIDDQPKRQRRQTTPPPTNALTIYYSKNEGAWRSVVSLKF